MKLAYGSLLQKCEVLVINHRLKISIQIFQFFCVRVNYLENSYLKNQKLK